MRNEHLSSHKDGYRPPNAITFQGCITGIRNHDSWVEKKKKFGTIFTRLIKALMMKIRGKEVKNFPANGRLSIVNHVSSVSNYAIEMLNPSQFPALFGVRSKRKTCKGMLSQLYLFGVVLVGVRRGDGTSALHLEGVQMGKVFAQADTTLVLAHSTFHPGIKFDDAVKVLCCQDKQSQNDIYRKSVVAALLETAPAVFALVNADNDLLAGTAGKLETARYLGFPSTTHLTRAIEKNPISVGGVDIYPIRNHPKVYWRTADGIILGVTALGKEVLPYDKYGKGWPAAKRAAKRTRRV